MAKGKQQFDYHHRVPKSKGGSDDISNLVEVNKKRHRAYHTCFDRHDGNGTRPATPEEVINDLITVWLDPAYEIILMKRPRTPPNQLSLDLD